MRPEHILIIILLALAALLICGIAVMLIRALRFKPQVVEEEEIEPIFVNSEKATHDLAEMIKCRTISERDRSLEDEAEFDKFKALLPELFPTVFKKCTQEYPTDRSILLHWKGRKSENPTVLMSHFDVVSVVEEDWEKPAFEGIIENGVLWGRGTLDTKGTLNGALQAAEALMNEGFVPENDIYFAFSGNEEINGGGSPAIVDLFEERGITPGLVVDEGGAVVENVFPGVKQPAALIGVCEKGMLNVQYTVKGGGGHSSSPAPHTPVGRLSKACCKLENHPFKFRMSPASLAMFDTLGRHSTFLYRLIFANVDIFAPILDIYTRLTGGEFNATVRTTTAFTMMEGSKGVNVIPPVAKMMSNHRLAPGDTQEMILAEIKKVCEDEHVKVERLEGNDPSRISVMKGESYERVRDVVHKTWPEAIVSPYPMVACSDSRHWGRISDKVYRFSAMALSKEERGTIHGNNERIPLATIAKTVEFYVRLIKKS